MASAVLLNMASIARFAVQSETTLDQIMIRRKKLSTRLCSMACLCVPNSVCTLGIFSRTSARLQGAVPLDLVEADRSLRFDASSALHRKFTRVDYDDHILSPQCRVEYQYLAPFVCRRWLVSMTRYQILIPRLLTQRERCERTLVVDRARRNEVR